MLIGGPREQVRHPRHPPAPGGLELVEDAPRPADGGPVGVDELLATAPLLGDQAGALEHRDVLLDGGEAHGVVGGEAGDRRLARGAAAQDVAARAVGERVEHAVHVGVGKVTYNHAVVR